MQQEYAVKIWCDKFDLPSYFCFYHFSPFFVVKVLIFGLILRWRNTRGGLPSNVNKTGVLRKRKLRSEFDDDLSDIYDADVCVL